MTTVRPPHRPAWAGRTVSSRLARAAFAATTATVSLTATPVLAGAATTHEPSAAAAATGSSIAVLNGPFGPMLVAGSGPNPGTALYMITSDYGSTYGCTTKTQNVGGGPYVCTGPETGKSEWPAYTTKAAPVAGPGAQASLLGEVGRPGVGAQVTYDGHPLYLFDEIPGVPGGEAWNEPSLPADHGTWYLVSPNGTPLGWEGILTTTMVKGRKVLAEMMIDGGGWAAFPVYSYSGGTACTGACAAAFPPVYAEGSPGLGAGLPTGQAGLVTRGDGSVQRTWGGKPLYLYGDESIQLGPTGVVMGGNGNGMSAPGGGRFSLVAP